MKCQWCGKEFPSRKGRFCRTCKSPQQLAIQFAQSEAERLGGLLRAEQQKVFTVEADCDRYREDRNLEKQMRKQAEGQRERYREALERIANDTDSEKWAGVDFKVIARHALKEVEK